MTPEGRVKAKLDKALRNIPNCYKFKPVQMGLGAATLDYLLCVKGNFIGIETKANALKELTERQKITRKEMEAAHGRVFVVYDDVSLWETIVTLQNLKPVEAYIRNRNWHVANPITKEERRASKLKYRNGMDDPADYDKMLAEQGGHCFFCSKTPETQLHGVLCVDHCRETKKPRGLLCRQHNSALGLFGDNEAGVLKLLAYVRGTQ